MDGLVENAPAESKSMQSSELSKKAEKIEDLNKNKKASRFDLIDFDLAVKEAPAEGVFLSRLVHLYKKNKNFD